MNTKAQSSQTDAGLVAKGLKKVIKKRTILNDVSLHVSRGEVVALLGPNGAGKTSTFYAVAGLNTVDSGEITMDRQDVTDWPVYKRARQGLGYLPQEPSIFRGMSVEDNIRAILQVMSKDKVWVQNRLEQLLQDFGLGRIRHAPAVALSGGERRRVEIARGLASNPTYILLDEPFAGIDPIAIGDIRALVSDLKTRGIGVLITDHNVRETLSIVDRAYILHEGRVIMEGTPEDIVNNESVRKVYLGEDFKLS